MADFGKVFVQSMTNALTMSQRDNEFKTQFALEEMKAEREGKDQEFRAQKLLDQIASEDKFRLKLLDNAATTESRQEFEGQLQSFDRSYGQISKEDAEKYNIASQPIESLQSQYKRLPLEERKGVLVTDSENLRLLQSYKASEFAMERERIRTAKGRDEMLRLIKDFSAVPLVPEKMTITDTAVWENPFDPLGGLKQILPRFGPGYSGSLYPDATETRKQAIKTDTTFTPNYEGLVNRVNKIAPLAIEALARRDQPGSDLILTGFAKSLQPLLDSHGSVDETKYKLNSGAHNAALLVLGIIKNENLDDQEKMINQQIALARLSPELKTASLDEQNEALAPLLQKLGTIRARKFENSVIQSQRVGIAKP